MCSIGCGSQETLVFAFWLRFGRRAPVPVGVLQSLALIPIASESPGQSLLRLGDSTPPEHRDFSDQLSAPTRKVFARRKDQNRWPLAQSRLSRLCAVLQRLPDSATEVDRPSLAAEPCPPACKLSSFPRRPSLFPLGIGATCGSTQDRSYSIGTPSRVRPHKRISRAYSRDFSAPLAAHGRR